MSRSSFIRKEIRESAKIEGVEIHAIRIRTSAGYKAIRGIVRDPTTGNEIHLLIDSDSFHDRYEQIAKKLVDCLEKICEDPCPIPKD